MDNIDESSMAIWGEEVREISRGKTLKFRITKHLHSKRSKFQQIDVVDTQFYGRMLLLDGVIMLSESDEFSYHEMSSHVPILSHPDPKRVLVIGGGDGGVVREVIKYSCIEHVHLCEIDEEVVSVCKKYFPSISSGLSDPRVSVGYEDGAEYAKKHQAEYDIIIVDSTDPVGPGIVLFQEPFYRSMKGCLRKNGIAITQSESFFDEPRIIQSLCSFVPSVFKYWGYYWTCVPTYPSGIIGFSFVSDSVDPYNLEIDSNRIPKDLRYYNKEIHKAAFSVPEFAKEIIAKA